MINGALCCGYASQLAASSKIHVLDSFVDLHEARGDFAAALTALRQRQVESEKRSGETVQARAAELREAFDAERREAQIARLQQTERARVDELRLKDAELRARQAESERARWQNYGLLSAIALGLVATGAILSRQRLKAKTNRRILEEARAAQRVAEEADRVKTRFLGIASHDIRGPLVNIIHLTTELRQESPANEVATERCDMIGSEAQRVICLVEDLITTAALESGRLEIRKAPMDVAETTRAVIESLRWQANAKRQTIRFAQPSAGEGRLEGDVQRLHQVIANLLTNAIKFSPAGGEIGVTVARSGKNVTLAVRDSGAGIPAEDVPKLFSPFERLATHPTAGETSHGLGLSIAQEIVRRHGGEIRVDSKPGQGSTFTVIIPAQPAENESLSRGENGRGVPD